MAARRIRVMTRAAIMQPTYLPWLGYFALIDQVDVFVFLDDVAFDRRSWQQRNRIKGPNGEVMLTVPVRKAPRGTPVCDIAISTDQDFPDQHLRALEHSYHGAPFFDQYWPELRAQLQEPQERLSQLTVGLVEWLAGQLGVAARFVRSSDLPATGAKDEYLAAICQLLDVTSYLSPVGSKGYLEGSAAFSERGISVSYLDFDHPVYPQQHGEFISHLAAVDVLFNVGDEAGPVLRSGLDAGISPRSSG